MKKLIATLTLTASLSLQCASGVNAGSDVNLQAPYPAVSIFAVVMPEGSTDFTEHCRIALLREGTSDAVFPDDPTIALRRFVYLDIDARAVFKDGEEAPLSFYFPVSPSFDIVVASVTVPSACDTVSHLEILKARCRINGSVTTSYAERAHQTLDHCIHGLPRRLDIFTDVSVTGLTPYNNPNEEDGQ